MSRTIRDLLAATDRLSELEKVQGNFLRIERGGLTADGVRQYIEQAFAAIPGENRQRAMKAIAEGLEEAIEQAERSVISCSASLHKGRGEEPENAD